jgi:hypothetical protein
MYSITQYVYLAKIFFIFKIQIFHSIHLNVKPMEFAEFPTIVFRNSQVILAILLSEKSQTSQKSLSFMPI